MKNRIIIIFGVIVLILIAYNFSSIQEYMIPIQYGDRVGKDTIQILGNGKFQILNLPDSKSLITYDDNNDEYVLLAEVIKYQKHRGYLYVASKEGYAVVNGIHNTAKVFITVKKQTYSNSAPKVNNITYFTTYQQFSEKERKILDALK